MKQSVNFNGFSPAARARQVRRAFSAESLIASMRALGMTDEEIKAALLKMQAARDAASKPDPETK